MTENATTGPVPDTAMMTGSDEGEPGDRLTDRPGPHDSGVVEELRVPAPPLLEPLEASPAVLFAADDDAPLPSAEAGPQDDGLTPIFREPQDP
jgi:hypothetical protein